MIKPTYGVYEETKRIVVSYAGQPVLSADRDWEFIQLADECRSGKLDLANAQPEPVTIYDQRWLLRLASEALAMAAECWRG